MTVLATKITQIVVGGPPLDAVVVSKITKIVIADTNTVVDPGTLPENRRRVTVGIYRARK